MSLSHSITASKRPKGRDDVTDSEFGAAMESIPAAAVKPTNPKDQVAMSKAPMSVVPQMVLMELGVGMLEGGCKYGVYNYRVLGVRGSIYYDATMRHLMAWWEGQDIDPDSGMSHITKAITSLIVLRDAMLMDRFEDDRPPRNPDLEAFKAELDRKAAALVARYAPKQQPHHYTQLNMTPNLGAKHENSV